MAKPRKNKPTIIDQEITFGKAGQKAPGWEVFFHDQRSPLLRSQLITALMSGHQLEVERLPTQVLLDAVLLSMTTRNYLEAEIVDDYQGLLSRTDEKWKDPMWTRRVFDQMHAGTADFIIRGTNEFKCAEDLYIPELVQWWLEHDVPEYFSEELAA